MTPPPPPPPPVRRLKTKTRTARRKQRQPRQKRNSRRPIRRELSAGGVAVRQERGAWMVALLKTEHRRGEVWVLPKGHVEMEVKERVSDAARREVEEETGLSGLTVKDQLGVARFSFQAEEALVRKTVHYYLMITQQKELYPQEEEYFIDAAWFPIDVAIRMLEYDTDQKIVAKAREKLQGNSTVAPARQPRQAGVKLHT